MIYLNVVLTVRDAADVPRVRGLLETMSTLSRAEPGCARFEVYHSTAEMHVFLLVEHWQSQAHLDAHRLAPAFTTHYTPNVLPLVERAPHPSELLGG